MILAQNLMRTSPHVRMCSAGPEPLVIYASWSNLIHTFFAGSEKRCMLQHLYFILSRKRSKNFYKTHLTVVLLTENVLTMLKTKRTLPYAIGKYDFCFLKPLNNFFFYFFLGEILFPCPAKPLCNCDFQRKYRTHSVHFRSF